MGIHGWSRGTSILGWMGFRSRETVVLKDLDRRIVKWRLEMIHYLRILFAHVRGSNDSASKPDKDTKHSEDESAPRLRVWQADLEGEQVCLWLSTSRSAICKARCNHECSLGSTTAHSRQKVSGSAACILGQAPRTPQAPGI